MKKQPLLWGIIVLQVLILGGMLLKAMLPLMTGRDVTLQPQAVDPRDLMRGNYAALNYEFSNMRLDSIPNDLTGEYSFGDEVYVELRDTDSTAVVAGIWQNPKEGAINLRAIVRSRNWYSKNWIELTAGIENYFANPEKALELEKNVRNGSNVKPIVVVAIAPSGEARIRRLEYRITTRKPIEN